ncbi:MULTISPECIES: PD-(D/E)XK nuclease family protein [unclassified Flavobacterium]|uniref:PDDEXK-like family protein n=1 Tax=unclassified Flavobacterium TaxID=196869 RepID=UPI003F91C727
MDEINNLLQQVAEIQDKYDTQAKESGENFNVFSIMNMEHNEVYTHSAIIGELLNPNGSHGQGDVFLQLFVKELQNEFGPDIIKNEFGTLISDKICERTISLEIDWENITGGRIDLIIEDHKQILIIENKLYAVDQLLQLIRYDNYAKTKKKNYTILYLTLFGKSLEKEEHVEGLVRGYNFSHKEINEYKKFVENNKNNNCLYYPISFEVHILNWIKKCLEALEFKPLLKATLEQYLALIKKITFQTMSNEMKKKIISIILDNPQEKEKNVKAAFEIVESIENLKRKIYYDFFQLLNKYAQDNNIICDEKNLNDAKGYGLYFIPNGWNSKPYQIGVFFDSDYSGLYVGLSYGKNGVEQKLKIKEKFTNIDSRFRSNDYWIWKNPENCNWKDNSEIWVDIVNGVKGKTYNDIILIIQEIIDIENS